MFQALKGITGLVRSGALKNGFDVEIIFKKDNEEIIAKKRVYQIEKGVIFLNNFLNDLKSIQKVGFKNATEESKERFTSMFKDSDLNKIICNNELNDKYKAKKMYLISKKGKRYPFDLKEKK